MTPSADADCSAETALERNPEHSVKCLSREMDKDREGITLKAFGYLADRNTTKADLSGSDFCPPTPSGERIDRAGLAAQCAYVPRLGLAPARSTTCSAAAARGGSAPCSALIHARVSAVSAAGRAPRGGRYGRAPVRESGSAPLLCAAFPGLPAQRSVPEFWAGQVGFELGGNLGVTSGALTWPSKTRDLRFLLIFA